VGQLNLLTDWLQTVSQSTNISSKLPVHHSLEHVASELQERLLAASFVCRDLYRSDRFSEGETPVVHRCAPSRLAKDYALDLKPGLFLVVLILSRLDLCLLVSPRRLAQDVNVDVENFTPQQDPTPSTIVCYLHRAQGGDISAVNAFCFLLSALGTCSAHDRNIFFH